MKNNNRKQEKQDNKIVLLTNGRDKQYFVRDRLEFNLLTLCSSNN